MSTTLQLRSLGTGLVVALFGLSASLAFADKTYADEIYAVFDGQLQRLGIDEMTTEPIGPVGSIDFFVDSLTFTPEGQLLALAENRSIYEIDLATGQAAQLLPPISENSARYSELTAVGAGWCFLLRASEPGGVFDNLILLNLETGEEAVVGEPELPPSVGAVDFVRLRTLSLWNEQLVGMAYLESFGQVVSVGPTTAAILTLSPSTSTLPVASDSDSDDHLWILSDSLTTPPIYTLRAFDVETGQAINAKAVYSFFSYFPFAVRRGEVGACQTSDSTLCFLEGRFQVEVTWRDGNDRTGVGKPVPGTTDNTGLMWFFSEDNWELMIKVLDGCSINDRTWVFLSGTTNVEFTVTVTDTMDGSQQIYQNPLDTAAQTILDTDAFAQCSGET